MVRITRFFAVVFCAFFLCSCGGGGDDIVIGPYTPAISSPVKIRVADVWNDTHRVYSVDVIGLLWNGLEDSLRRRGMLWTPQMGGQPLSLEAHVVQFKPGGMAQRFIPLYGDTTLEVTCSLRDGDREIATIESKHKIAMGSGTFTRNASKKIFAEVSEDVVNQAIRKF